MIPRSIILALGTAFGFTMCGMLGILAVFALPGSSLIQLISLDTDGRNGILIRTVSRAIIGQWTWEVDSANGDRVCGKSGQTIFEERGKDPVMFPLDGVDCDKISGGVEYVLRFSVAPLVLFVPLRPTVIETTFTAAERDALP